MIAVEQRKSTDEMFYTRRNRLTRYALACGYIEQYVHCSGRYAGYVTLSMQHGVLFVRAHDEQLYAGNDLTQARATYDAEVRAFKYTIR